MKPGATLKDVAKLAGVSTAVVSYVVNDGPKNVSPASEAKVREAIRLLGYQPNVAARALRSGSSRLLAIVLPDVTNPFFASLAQAVEEAAAERGYSLIIASSGHSLATERSLLGDLAGRRVDGVFLCSVAGVPDVRGLESSGIPAVLLDHGEPGSGHRTIGVDLEEGARVAVEHLIEHGHREIGLVVGGLVGGRLDGRELGWRNALEDAGLRPGRVLRGAFDRETGYAAGQQILAATERPTAVFASSDLQAVGLLRAFHDGSVRVPDDLAVVSFDGSKEAEYAVPRLTTISQPVEDMGRAAVHALLGDGGSASDSDGAEAAAIFPTTLLRRASCGCAET